MCFSKLSALINVDQREVVKQYKVESNFAIGGGGGEFKEYVQNPKSPLSPTTPKVVMSVVCNK